MIDWSTVVIGILLFPAYAYVLARIVAHGYFRSKMWYHHKVCAGAEREQRVY